MSQEEDPSKDYGDVLSGFTYPIKKTEPTSNQDVYEIIQSLREELHETNKNLKKTKKKMKKMKKCKKKKSEKSKKKCKKSEKIKWGKIVETSVPKIIDLATVIAEKRKGR